MYTWGYSASINPPCPPPDVLGALRVSAAFIVDDLRRHRLAGGCTHKDLNGVTALPFSGPDVFLDYINDDAEQLIRRVTPAGHTFEALLPSVPQSLSIRSLAQDRRTTYYVRGGRAVEVRATQLAFKRLR